MLYGRHLFISALDMATLKTWYSAVVVWSVPFPLFSANTFSTGLVPNTNTSCHFNVVESVAFAEIAQYAQLAIGKCLMLLLSGRSLWPHSSPAWCSGSRPRLSTSCWCPPSWEWSMWPAWASSGQTSSVWSRENQHNNRQSARLHVNILVDTNCCFVL